MDSSNILCNMILFGMFHALDTATCNSWLRDKNEITKAQQIIGCNFLNFICIFYL